MTELWNKILEMLAQYGIIRILLAILVLFAGWMRMIPYCASISKILFQSSVMAFSFFGWMAIASAFRQYYTTGRRKNQPAYVCTPEKIAPEKRPPDTAQSSFMCFLSGFICFLCVS